MSIILQNVSYSYGIGQSDEKQALSHIDLEIGKDEVIALVGQTGSGKSTLFEVLNGLEKATEGSIYCDGEDIYDKDFSIKKLHSKVGLVFQYPEHQLFESTVIKDVQFGPENMGWDKLKIEMNSFQALKDVGISDELLDVSPLVLSGGQKRRVAIAGVLAMEPEYLILDEPMAGLDPRGREEIFKLLLEIQAKRHMTILFSSHSMEDVARYAKRMLVMHNGKIVLDGSPAKIFRYRKELKKIGLEVPKAVSILQALGERGLPVRTDLLTPEEAAREIHRVLSEEK